MTDFDQKKRTQVKVTSFKKKERLRLKFYRLIDHALDEISALQTEIELPDSDKAELEQDVSALAGYIYARLTGREVMHALSPEKLDSLLKEDDDEDA